MPKVFDNVLYASCWEDPSLDREAFQISSDSTVFTITSGGCNALAFLLDDPMEVIALDLNPHQNFLLHLKIAAFRTLDYSRLLQFMGVRSCADRLAMYATLRGQLPADARGYWDTKAKEIKKGILHSGRFERYMQMLRRVLTVLIGKEKIEGIFERTGAQERTAYYRDHWMTLRWKLFLSLFLSRRVMTMLFDGAFFAQLGEKFSFGKHFEHRVRFALTELPMPPVNPFLSYIMLGAFREPMALPMYLRKEHFDTIRARLDRITIISDSCESYFATLADNRITHFNFTNIFEWMPVAAFEDLLRSTVRVARQGATLTYRNLLVPRSRPDSLSTSIVPDVTLAERLARRDLSFIYSNYHVEHVRKGFAS